MWYAGEFYDERLFKKARTVNDDDDPSLTLMEDDPVQPPAAEKETMVETTTTTNINQDNSHFNEVLRWFQSHLCSSVGITTTTTIGSTNSLHEWYATILLQAGVDTVEKLERKVKRDNDYLLFLWERALLSSPLSSASSPSFSSHHDDDNIDDVYAHDRHMVIDKERHWNQVIEDAMRCTQCLLSSSYDAALVATHTPQVTATDVQVVLGISDEKVLREKEKRSLEEMSVIANEIEEVTELTDLMPSTTRIDDKLVLDTTLIDQTDEFILCEDIRDDTMKETVEERIKGTEVENNKLQEVDMEIDIKVEREVEDAIYPHSLLQPSTPLATVYIANALPIRKSLTPLVLHPPTSCVAHDRKRGREEAEKEIERAFERTTATATCTPIATATATPTNIPTPIIAETANGFEAIFEDPVITRAVTSSTSNEVSIIARNDSMHTPATATGRSHFLMDDFLSITPQTHQGFALSVSQSVASSSVAQRLPFEERDIGKEKDNGSGDGGDVEGIAMMDPSMEAVMDEISFSFPPPLPSLDSSLPPLSTRPPLHSQPPFPSHHHPINTVTTYPLPVALSLPILSYQYDNNDFEKELEREFSVLLRSPSLASTECDEQEEHEEEELLSLFDMNEMEERDLENAIESKTVHNVEVPSSVLAVAVDLPVISAYFLQLVVFEDIDLMQLQSHLLPAMTKVMSGKSEFNKNGIVTRFGLQDYLSFFLFHLSSSSPDQTMGKEKEKEQEQETKKLVCDCIDRGIVRQFPSMLATHSLLKSHAPLPNSSADNLNQKEDARERESEQVNSGYDGIKVSLNLLKILYTLLSSLSSSSASSSSTTSVTFSCKDVCEQFLMNGGLDVLYSQIFVPLFEQTAKDSGKRDREKDNEKEQEKERERQNIFLVIGELFLLFWRQGCLRRSDPFYLCSYLWRLGTCYLLSPSVRSLPSTEQLEDGVERSFFWRLSDLCLSLFHCIMREPLYALKIKHMFSGTLVNSDRNSGGSTAVRDGRGENEGDFFVQWLQALMNMEENVIERDKVIEKEQSQEDPSKKKQKSKNTMDNIAHAQPSKSMKLSKNSTVNNNAKRVRDENVMNDSIPRYTVTATATATATATLTSIAPSDNQRQTVGLTSRDTVNTSSEGLLEIDMGRERERLSMLNKLTLLIQLIHRSKHLSRVFHYYSPIPSPAGTIDVSVGSISLMIRKLYELQAWLQMNTPTTDSTNTGAAIGGNRMKVHNNRSEGAMNRRKEMLRVMREQTLTHVKECIRVLQCVNPFFVSLPTNANVRTSTIHPTNNPATSTVDSGNRTLSSSSSRGSNGNKNVTKGYNNSKSNGKSEDTTDNPWLMMSDIIASVLNKDSNSNSTHSADKRITKTITSTTK